MFLADRRARRGRHPRPSPSPAAVPQIAHVVTSDRGIESAARDGPHDLRRDRRADRAGRRSHRRRRDRRRFPASTSSATAPSAPPQRVGIRGSSSQQVLVLVDGLPIAGGQIDDVNLEQVPVGGIDRIEVVEGGGSTLYGSGSIGGVINIITAPLPTRSSATVSTGSFGEQTYQFQTPYVSFQRTYATNDYSVENAPNRQNAQAGLDRRLRALRAHPSARFDLTLTGDLADAQVGAPGELGYFSPTSEQGNVNRNLQLNARACTARGRTTTLQARRLVARPFVHLQYAGRFRTARTRTIRRRRRARRRIRRTRRCSTTSTGWRACATSSATRAQRLVYGIDLMRGVARIDEGTGGGSPSAADNAPDLRRYAQTAAYVQSQWFWQNGNQLYAGHARASATAAWAARTRPRSAASSISPAACSYGSTRRRRFARRPRRSSTIPASPIRICIAGAHARRRRDARCIRRCGAASASAGSRPAGRT